MRAIIIFFHSPFATHLILPLSLLHAHKRTSPQPFGRYVTWSFNLAESCSVTESKSRSVTFPLAPNDPFSYMRIPIHPKWQAPWSYSSILESIWSSFFGKKGSECALWGPFPQFPHLGVLMVPWLAMYFLSFQQQLGYLPCFKFFHNSF